MECPRLEYIWGDQTCRSLEYCRDTASNSRVQQPSSPMILCPCLVTLEIRICYNLVMLPNLPTSLKDLAICECGELSSVSGQLSALEKLHIFNCSKLLSVQSLGDASSLETLFLSSCKCLASIGSSSGPGSYLAFRGLEIEYCPALDMRQFDKNVLGSLVQKEISHAHSSNPREGILFNLLCFVS